jgi:4-hydroxy-tetrahydrodipicolinate synthase
LIAAIGTPLNAEETLHREGLERLLDLQWGAGINGVLVAGTMGLLQLLREQTYADLIKSSVEISKNRGEILVGVGDTGFARTADRVALANEFPIDGVVVLPPYLIRFGPSEVIDYFRGLAELSSAPLFIYDHPSLTGVKLDAATIAELSNHPNIAGIKCSGDLNDSLELMECVDDGFRVIVAKADQVDVLCQQGIVNHLDGIFSLVPEWIVDIAQASEARDWTAAAEAQRKASGVLNLLREYGVFPTYNELMHLRGIPGLFAPKPFRLLDEAKCELLKDDPFVQLLACESRRINRTALSNGVVRHQVTINDGEPRPTTISSDKIA